MAETIEESIRENAGGPKRASGDSGSVDQHSLKDQIEADRYLASKQAVQKPLAGIRRTVVSPPGAI